MRFLTKPDLIVIVYSPTMYFVENQLQINNIANEIVKNKRKYSLPANRGAKHAPMTTKKIGYSHTSFFDGNSISFPLPHPYLYKTKREVSQLLFSPLTL